VPTFLRILKRIDCFTSQHIVLFALLVLLIALRLPNFSEPYWYGDEAIYLTLGTAMRHGERLYAEIIDHKTPIIYYLAMVPTQTGFRMLNVASTILTTTFFYFFARKVIKNEMGIGIASLFFVLLTTLPWFEGHIPNGELFVMFFIFIGATFFGRTELFQHFLKSEKTDRDVFPLSPRQLLLFFSSGVFFSLGILTKVPALFDVLAFLFIFWSLFVETFITRRESHKVKRLVSIVLSGAVCVAGVITPIVLSILYFIARGSGQAYLDYGLLYNFHYVESFVPSFSLPFLRYFFTFPVKTGLLALLLIGLTAGTRVLSSRFRFIAAWVGLALFSSLLSNRPYPHYYLQIIPPLALLLGYFVETVMSLRERHAASVQIKKAAEVAISLGLGGVFIAILLLLHVGLYSNVDYYGKFFKMLSGRMSAIEYRDSFNSFDADNYKASAIIRTSKEQRMFIWGTNPMLYALSGKSPTGRFTVAFHIYDFKALDETLADVKKHAPQFVVVMKEEKPFPQLSSYLEQYYTPNMQFRYFTLWKRE
jgi:hypothetical protein